MQTKTEKQSYKYPSPRIIVLEGINGVGKTTLFNSLKKVNASPDIGFLDFPKFHLHKNSDPRVKAAYVNNSIAEVWGKYPVIIADRWLLTELIYQMLNPRQFDLKDSYLNYIKPEYKEHVFPSFVYLKKPKNVFVSYYRMHKRNKEQKKNEFFSFFKYLKLYHIYYTRLARLSFCKTCKNKDLVSDVFSIQMKANQYVSDQLFVYLNELAGYENKRTGLDYI